VWDRQEVVYSTAEAKLFFRELEGRNRWCFAEADADDDGKALDQTVLDDGLQPHLDNASALPQPESRDDRRKVACTEVENIRCRWPAPRAGCIPDLLLAQAAYRYRKIRQMLLDARRNADGVDALLDPECRAACAQVSCHFAAFRFTSPIPSTVCMIALHYHAAYGFQ